MTLLRVVVYDCKFFVRLVTRKNFFHFFGEILIFQIYSEFFYSMDHVQTRLCLWVPYLLANWPLSEIKQLISKEENKRTTGENKMTTRDNRELNFFIFQTLGISSYNIPSLFFSYFVSPKRGQWTYKIFLKKDLNSGPLVQEVTALLTSPLSLPSYACARFKTYLIWINVKRNFRLA